MPPNLSVLFTGLRFENPFLLASAPPTESDENILEVSDQDYWTMKEIGRTFGTTSHVVGRKLKELGLRTEDGKPSPEAFQRELCCQRWARDMQHYCWAWHGEKTIRLLQEHSFGASPANGQDRNGLAHGADSA